MSCACWQARPCLRANIHKTEVRGPKTSPFVVYILHMRTAFTVRGMSRRYSDFVLLDTKLRAHFGDAAQGTRIPMLPPKRMLGHLSPDFVAERRRQLQDYLDRLMAQALTAHSLPVLDFLEVSAAALCVTVGKEGPIALCFPYQMHLQFNRHTSITSSTCGTQDIS